LLQNEVEVPAQVVDRARKLMDDWLAANVITNTTRQQ